MSQVNNTPILLKIKKINYESDIIKIKLLILNNTDKNITLSLINYKNNKKYYFKNDTTKCDSIFIFLSIDCNKYGVKSYTSSSIITEISSICNPVMLKRHRNLYIEMFNVKSKPNFIIITVLYKVNPTDSLRIAKIIYKM